MKHAGQPDPTLDEKRQTLRDDVNAWVDGFGRWRIFAPTLLSDAGLTPVDITEHEGEQANRQVMGDYLRDQVNSASKKQLDLYFEWREAYIQADGNLDRGACEASMEERASSSYTDITRGSRVTIADRFGQTHTGRAVMLGPYGWVLDMGGAHGTPGIASPDNFVRTSAGRGAREESGAEDFPSIAAAIDGAKRQGATRVWKQDDQAVVYFPAGKGLYYSALVYHELGKWHVSTVERHQPPQALPREAEECGCQHAGGYPIHPVEKGATEAASKCVPWVRVQRDPKPFKACLKRYPVVTDASVVYKMLAPQLAKEDQEVFLVLVLDNAGHVKGVSEVARGSRGSVQVDIDEIFRVAYVEGASGIIVVHNHPSGDARPSENDSTFTAKLKEKADLLRKGWLFDHVIVGLGEYYSYQDGNWTGSTVGRHTGASDYVAVGPRGGKIGGPYKDYETAKKEADKGGGYVEFVMTEEATEKVDVLYEAAENAPQVSKLPGCEPFDVTVRDPEKFNACRALAAKIGAVDNARAVYELLSPALETYTQEVFVVVVTDVRGQVKRIQELHRGGPSSVPVDVGLVLRAVLTTPGGGEIFMVVHNHPSGKADPSPKDRELTRAIQKAADPFGRALHFADHVVIGMGQYYSFEKAKWTDDPTMQGLVVVTKASRVPSRKASKKGSKR